MKKLKSSLSKKRKLSNSYNLNPTLLRQEEQARKEDLSKTSLMRR